MPTARAYRGQTNHAAGLAAERIVTRHYQAAGARLLASRWKGPGGEIDLIFAEGPVTVFVEVKKARSFDAALQRLGPRQLQRIAASASAYTAGEMRIDLAVVDGIGDVQVLKGIMLE